MTADQASTAGFDAVAAALRDRLSRNQRVRRTLPGQGRIRIDRQLPFLCVYRAPDGRDDHGTRELVTTEAAYLFASGERKYLEGLRQLCATVAGTVQEHLGLFLLIEIWADDGRDAGPPAFRIVSPDLDLIPSTIESLAAAVAEIDITGQTAEIAVETGVSSPPDLPPLAPSGSKITAGGTVTLGLAVRPVYRSPETGDVYPAVLQSLRRQLAAAIRQAVRVFSGRGADESFHYDALGPSALTQAARETDRVLCDVASAFDFLQMVTPVNSDEAWQEFQGSQFREIPNSRYRPLPYRPSLLKRQLFQAPIEEVEDATLAELFAEKQIELDRQLTALRDLGSTHFLYESLQLYGRVDEQLAELARAIHQKLSPEAGSDEGAKRCVDAAEFADRARQQIRRYQQRTPDFEAAVTIGSEIAAGLMVVRNCLHASHTLSVSRERVEPLLHHEVGTHLLTYVNGQRQPLRLLSAGLAGYEPLQEGLAVLAEYLVGGLTRARLRTLASRVLAVDLLVKGASFSESFHALRDSYGISPRAAFTTCLRAYRGGGLTKDAIYLRGFSALLDYLRHGHDVEPLYVGKIGLHHVPYMRELRRRAVVSAPHVLPLFWQSAAQRERLETCRRDSLLELVESVR